MNQITFKNINTGKSITLHLASPLLISSGKEEYIHDGAVSQIIMTLFGSPEKLLSYPSLVDIVRKEKGVHHMADMSEGSIANKYIFQVRSLLKKLSIDDFIQTIRGKGYKVTSNWQPVLAKQPPKNRQESFLEEVRTIVQEAIDYCQQAEVVHDKSGLLFVKTDKIQQLGSFAKMNRCYQNFLTNYSELGNGFELLEVREKLMNIMHYVIQWRLGAGISDTQFKADYQNELKLLLKQLENAVSLLDH